MRIYIIGNDGITLCRKAPATVNDGEIVVASNVELHAAPLSGKRLLALWNALRRCRSPTTADRSPPRGRRLSAAFRGHAGPGTGSRRKAAIEAGRGDCHAAATRGRNRG